MPSLRIVESARANGDPASPRRPRRYQTNLIPFSDTWRPRRYQTNLIPFPNTWRPRRYQTNLIPFPDTVGRTSRSAFFPAAPQPMRDNTREPFAAADRKNHEEETK